MWPLSAHMALPSPYSFCVLCIAYLPVLLLLVLLACLSALYASLSPLLQVGRQACNQVPCQCWLYYVLDIMQDIASTEHVRRQS